MAVEIPVVIDIEGGFEAAARRVNSAMGTLQSAIEGNPIHTAIRVENIDGTTDDLKELNKYFKELEDADWKRIGSKFDFSPYINQSIMELQSLEKQLNDIQEMRQSEGGSGDFSFAEEYKALRQQADNVANSIRAMEIAQEQFNQASNGGEFRRYIDSLSATNEELSQMREYYRELEGSTAKMSDSINAIRGRIRDLNAEWDNMTKAERESASGLEVRSRHKEEVRLLREEALTLDQLLRKEKQKADLVEKGIKARRYENAILNSNIKTIRVLQEQERILSERLSRATIGSGKYNQLKKDLEAVRAELEQINGGLVKTEGKLERLLKNSLRLFAIHTGARFVKNIREVTSEFELQRVALGSIIQDTERAEGLFRQIKAAAIESPFEIKDLVSYTKQLSAYQIETDKLFDTTMRLADVSAGLGVDMGRLILAFGQVRAAAVLRGQELRQFTEAGIPLVEKLAEKFRELGREGTTTADVFQLISERAVPFSMVEEIFNDMTSAGGMFYKMQEKQAATLLGQWNNLKDSISIMYDEIGNTEVVHSAMETLIQDARSIMQNWRSWWAVIKVVGSGLASYYGIAKAASIATNMLAKSEKLAAAAESEREISMKKFVTSIIGKTAAEKVSTIATDAHTWAMNKASAAATGLGAAFWRLTAAMLSNPFGVLAVAIGGLIALFTTLGNKTRDVQKDLENAEKSIQALNKTREETANLINEYDELSKKTEKSVKEQERLRDISRELAKTFPGATKGIDENTKALTLNVEELRKYNEEAEAALRKGMSAQISMDEQTVAKNEKEIEKLTKSLNRGWGRNRTISLLSPFLTPLSKKQMAEMKDRIVELSDENESLNKSIQDQKDALAGVNKEQANTVENLLSWQDKLIEFNSRTREDGTQIRVLTDDQIKGYSKLDAVLEDLAKQYNEESEQVAILEAALKGKNEEEAKDIQLAIDRAILRRDLTKEILEYYNAFNLTQKKTGGGAHQTDPWITNMQERIKFMQDFKKGYDDLKKYVSSSSALAEEAGIMLGRGTSLGLSASDQQRAAENLSDWYDEMIKVTSERLRGKGVSGVTVTDLLGIDTTKRNKDIQELQKLLQSLWDAKTDFDLSQKKQDLEDALKKLSNEIKRSETARNFFNNILDLTGDEELAASMAINVYGGVGKDFKDRMQEELYRALTEIEPENIDKDLMSQIMGDITVLDIDDIKKNLEKLPPKVKEVFEKAFEDNEKDTADWYENFIKTYQKAKTYQERVDILEQKRAKARQEAQARDMSESDMASIDEYYNREVAKVQLEAMKDTYTWTKAFEDLEGVSSRTLENLIDLIDEYIDKYGKDLEPQQQHELARQRENAKQQLNSRNAYKATADAIKDLAAARKRANNLQKDGKDDSEDYTRALDDEMEAIKKLKAAFSEIESEVSDVIASTKDLMSVFASDEDASFFGGQLDNLSKTISGIGKASVGIAQIATGNITPQAIIQTITGLSDVVSGIFGSIKASQIRDINKQIERQQDLLDDLSYSYDRLEKAMAKAFGSDYIYNYNKQLENLNAQIEAYNAQAELERGKGKKADADKIKEYENNARDAQDQINDMQSQLSEFFAGTDLTSAAKDFATSWIEAYKEFGSTTDAMKERFQDLIESMVTQSLGAKIMQSILQPLFDEIDAMAASGGELTTGEIAKIANEAPMYIGQINDAMTNLMNQLGAAGYNLRQGVGGFTGISRDIAGASEESITGLAAGINTQNFYMSLISQNVAAILAAMTGETVEGATGAAVPDPYKEQVLTYMGSLPQMRDDMYAIRTLLERVIKPLGTNATHYVATRM